MATLLELANQFGSDKGSIHKDAHTYAYVYDMLFAPLRETPVKFCEIGLQIGGPEQGAESTRGTTDTPSIRMWQSYFRSAKVYGLDISDFSAFQNDTFEFHQVDCGDQKRLAEVAGKLPEMDVILDDGSHASFHQQLTFVELWPRLKSGGIYIIEDVNWVPKHIEAALPPVKKTAELFRFVDMKSDGSIGDRVRALRDQMADVMLISNGSLEGHRRFYNSTVLNTKAVRDVNRDAVGKKIERGFRRTFQRVEPNADYVKLIVIRKK
jgi:hypothetical protein